MLLLICRGRPIATAVPSLFALLLVFAVVLMLLRHCLLLLLLLLLLLCSRPALAPAFAFTSSQFRTLRGCSALGSPGTFRGCSAFTSHGQKPR